MPGRIKAEDVALVKERTSHRGRRARARHAAPGRRRLAEGAVPVPRREDPVVQRPPAVGRWHCFGCGEGGDVISFVQKVEHLTFTEAVERLAAEARHGAALRGGRRPRAAATSLGRRSRLVEAHRVAAGVLRRRSCSTPARGRGPAATSCASAASTARRPSGSASGSRPRGGEDAVAAPARPRASPTTSWSPAGSSGRGSRGLYDRFRGRLVWPIRDITGDTVGFGARRLFDDDRIEAKYLNTSETPIYKKSHGALRPRPRQEGDRRATAQAVIVEGYTDVMACHLAGVEGAVATCGTAFGVDHIKMLRRIMRDEADLAPAEVVFTFDGDAAGQKAAMRAFGEDQRWASQSFVAVADGGMDPCELRIAKGDDAVRAPRRRRRADVRVRRAHDDRPVRPDTAEGRVQAMRAAAPIVDRIRDSSHAPGVHPRPSRAGSASRSSRCRPRCPAPSGRPPPQDAKDARRRD